MGLLPLFDPPRHDSAETIKRALHLGVNVKMITGDQLAIGKETARRLGMGSNMYPSSSLLGDHKDESVAAIPVEELIEQADGFAGVFPGKYFSKLLFYSLIIFSVQHLIIICCNLSILMYICRAQIRDCENTSREKTHMWNDRRRC